VCLPILKTGRGADLTTQELSKSQSDHVIRQASNHASEVTIEETIRDFVADYTARDMSQATVYRYRHYVNDYAAWLAREDCPTDMGSLQGKRGFAYVRAYLDYLRKERSAAAGTVATAYRVLKTFWNWAVRESLDDDDEANNPPFVKKSPCDYFTKTEIPKDRVQDDVGEPYTPEEVRRILDAIGKPNSADLEVLRNRAIVHVLLASGVRRKELAGLMFSDYNPDNGVIEVRRSTAKQTRREDDSRMTTLYGEAMREVNRYVRHLRVSGMARGPLFPSLRGGQVGHRGRNLRSDSINQMLGRIIVRIQDQCRERNHHPEGQGCEHCIRHGGVHRFRSTWAIRQLQAGAKPSSVKAAGGWSSYEMLDRYSRKASNTLAIEDIRRVNNR